MPRQWTPEERKALGEKMKATRAAKQAAKAAAALDDYNGDPEVPQAPVDLGEDVRAERRRRLLADVPAETAALITDEELEKIDREETERALAEQKKQALADVRSIARQYARIEHDLVPADVMRSEEERKRLAEKVRIRVDLPEGGGALGFRIDGRLLRNGQEYTVTRAEFESLNYTFYRAHLSEVQFSTLDQHKRGNSANEVLSRRRPQLEVRDAA